MATETIQTHGAHRVLSLGDADKHQQAKGKAWGICEMIRLAGEANAEMSGDALSDALWAVQDLLNSMEQIIALTEKQA